MVHRGRFNVGSLPGNAIEQRTQNLTAQAAPEIARVNDQAIDAEVCGNERVLEHYAEAGFAPLAEKIAVRRADMRRAPLQRRKLGRPDKLCLDLVGTLEELVNLQRHIVSMVIEPLNHECSTAVKVLRLELHHPVLVCCLIYFIVYIDFFRRKPATVMQPNTKFWILLSVFQVAFGYAVFAVTREHYISAAADRPSAHAAQSAAPPAGFPSGITQTDVALLTSGPASGTGSQDPMQILRQADELFASKNYDRAADLYAQLLAFNPDDANIYNNLGLTLHYLGRSAEALQQLDEGVARDPGNQRIWLTLGFVNSQLGNTEQARAALTTATQIGSDESIRQSALQMLDELP